ncbi:hypothetical protein M378DRAFT_165441 [Amanita muscaria Koide BX008]|uniref:Uncharacterized protein n=1 Tax=Amanita muscaria (strain Koide BX008) TaxID=946122 RepID=A0A0C2WMF7_AMAMK|nr:hypothetical protein M378DRAFT_165441 [Amanita muscaria Koide BX008]
MHERNSSKQILAIIPKSRAALERYGHQVVIGNDLHRRKYEVVFVSRKHKSNSHAAETVVPKFEESWLCIPSSMSTSTEDGHVKDIEDIEPVTDKWIHTGKSSACGLYVYL